MNKKEFLKEIENKLKTGEISRREVLTLRGVDVYWCLECGHSEGEKFTKQGFCYPCEKEWKRRK